MGVNKLIRYFVLADLLLLGSWGLIAPIFAVFIVEKIVGATLVTVGMATAIGWLSRSIIQVPMGNFLDRRRGEKDDFYSLILSLGLASLTAFALAVVETVNQLYLVLAVHGVAFGIYTTAWTSIFSRHLDRARPAFDWALDRTAVGVAIAVSGLLGGIVASYFGFAFTFLVVGTLSFLTMGIILMVPSLILPPPKRRGASEGELEIHQRHTPRSTNV